MVSAAHSANRITCSQPRLIFPLSQPRAIPERLLSGDRRDAGREAEHSILLYHYSFHVRLGAEPYLIGPRFTSAARRRAARRVRNSSTSGNPNSPPVSTQYRFSLLPGANCPDRYWRVVISPSAIVSPPRGPSPPGRPHGRALGRRRSLLVFFPRLPEFCQSIY